MLCYCLCVLSVNRWRYDDTASPDDESPSENWNSDIDLN